MSSTDTDEHEERAGENAGGAKAAEGSGAANEGAPAATTTTTAAAKSANDGEKPEAKAKGKKGPRDARTYPRPPVGDPLYDAWAALDRGDHAKARELATALLAHEDEGVKQGAHDLLDRLKPDRVVLAVFALTLLLMVGLALTYISGPHAPHAH